MRKGEAAARDGVAGRGSQWAGGGLFLFLKCRGWRCRVARFSGAGGGLTKRDRGGGQHQKKLEKE